MPPNFKFTKEQITAAAVAVVQKNGMQGLTAKSLSEKLGCSVKPIFGLFRNMEEVRNAVLQEAAKMQEQYFAAETAKNTAPPYKAIGIGYIRFAKEQPELFNLLFMRKRSPEQIQAENAADREKIKPILQIIQQKTGLSEEQAYLFHLEMWFFVHGIASMLAASYLDWDLPMIETVLTDAFTGIQYRFSQEDKHNGCH